MSMSGRSESRSNMLGSRIRVGLLVDGLDDAVHLGKL